MCALKMDPIDWTNIGLDHSITNPIDGDAEDSGFCGNYSPPKVARLDDEVLLLRALIKEVNEPENKFIIPARTANENSFRGVSLAGNYPSKSKSGKYELKIVHQPEEQHR